MDARDTLASVSDADIAAVTARWGDTDTMREFGAGADVLEDIVTRLVGFAKEARDDGEQLFSCGVPLKKRCVLPPPHPDQRL